MGDAARNGRHEKTSKYIPPSPFLLIYVYIYIMSQTKPSTSLPQRPLLQLVAITPLTPKTILSPASVKGAAPVPPALVLRGSFPTCKARSVRPLIPLWLRVVLAGMSRRSRVDSFRNGGPDILGDRRMPIPFANCMVISVWTDDFPLCVLLCCAFGLFL